MIELRPDFSYMVDVPFATLSASFHPTFYPVYDKILKWLNRFSYSIDQSISSDLALLYLLGTKKFLDHREPSHLFRLILAAHLMQKKLIFSTTTSSQSRHLEIKWIAGNLSFPFSQDRAVMGCLVGFNLLDRYEVFDEDNVVLALKKHLPAVRLVRESSYCHTSTHKNLKLFYFEIEKEGNTPFTLGERALLKTHLEEKVKNSIQPLSPTVFMGNNDEDVYKNALILGREIQSLNDLPQVSITFDQQTGKEIIFRISIVHVAPFHFFSLGQCFFDSSFVSERVLIVGHLNEHPIEAHIFRLHLVRDSSFLRSDGSLDFYAARQKVVSSIAAAIGEFRDYNGGILIKQQELLDGLRAEFSTLPGCDKELVDAFFYAMTPLEKQITAQKDTLFNLFRFFQESRQQELAKGSYSCHIHEKNYQTFLVMRSDDSSMTAALLDALRRISYSSQDVAYNTIEVLEGVFFNVVLFQENTKKEVFVEAFQDALQKWNQKRKNRQTLRIASDSFIVSLDPRIGGENHSGELLRLLFEGLTRYDQHGKLENGVAETIDISSNLKEYTFKLRHTLWNNGSTVTAHDFEYSWKKILSPDFKTSFAHLFYPIKNAREAKEGKVLAEEIGVHAIDDRTLKVELAHPTPYFLQLTANTLYSPVHRIVDQQHPHWSYECDKNYPCNGPFQLKLNQPNQGYQLVKNPFYWDGNQVSLDQVTLTIMNPAQAIQAFRKDEVDWIGNPFASWHSFYKSDRDGIKDNYVFYPDCLSCWCVFNTASFPFNHVKLRQAFAHAIQRSRIISQFPDIPLNPAFSILLPHQNSRPLFSDHDAVRAQQLLSEGLQELGITKEQLPPLTLIFHDKWMPEYTAKCLKQQLMETLGIECVLKPFSWKAVFHKMVNSDFHLGLVNWTSWIDDPIVTLSTFKFADQELNLAKWENLEFQHLLSLSEQHINPFQRSSSQLKAEEILSREVPVVPLYNLPSTALLKSGFHVAWRSPVGPFNISRSFYKR